MTTEDRATRIAGQVIAFAQDIARDDKLLETLVGLAGERGYEINVSTLRKFFELSSGLAPLEMSNAQLESVAGGLDDGTTPLETAGMTLDATSLRDPMERVMQELKLTATDSQIGKKQSKMTAD